MKTLVVLGVVLVVIGSAMMKALWALAKWAGSTGPIWLGAWLAFEVSVNHWPKDVMFVLVPTTVLSLFVWHKLTGISWIDKKLNELNQLMFDLKQAKTRVY